MALNRTNEATSHVNLTTTDGELIHLPIKWRLKSDHNKLRETIIKQIPSLDVNFGDGKNPIFCAVKLRSDSCEILGVYLRANLGSDAETTQDALALQTAVEMISHDIHTVAKREARFRVRVMNSILDRVKEEDPNVPIAFLSRDGGALEHPMYVEFSEKSAKATQLHSGYEFTIFRDDDYIMLTAANSRTGYCNWIRLSIEKLAGSTGRFNKARISIALREGMGLKRSRTGPALSSVQKRMTEDKSEGTEELFSRLGMGLKLSSFNYEITGLKPGGGGKLEIRAREDHAQFWDHITPILLHLCLAKLDPDLRSETKVIRSGGSRRRTGNRRRRSAGRLLQWGRDDVRYISNTDPGEGGTRARHWVNSHIREVKLTRQSTIQDYRKRGFVIKTHEGKTVGYRMIRGHFRGVGELNWDGTYRFGKSASYYSAKAIRWLRHIESSTGVTIQHAERGGEFRIPLSNGYIQVDGYCPEKNTIYEFHGDVFHGNPNKFDEHYHCHPYDKTVTAGELLEKTLQREEVIRQLGFKLVTMWESDWDAIEQE